MFERVATLVAIADMMHDSSVFTHAGGLHRTLRGRSLLKLEDFDNKLHIGSLLSEQVPF